ncbi:Acetyl/propionyl-CoA carboxylase, alpha subunit [uncultured Desulfobacterium sp.]|uniref:Acetyl/propionyl-CoA carboxylase, alpha subunit n=1 Tax=uncultured Desulfobacterium sp. TaxID=201089 RepID=A0A445MZ97_9BACT|nr:Acetyl/propionyl-CoA carboxylase, alpha subunit [uncultured Desulfobacterium sp.]
MFNKILIANRGEIAIRIIRTCKRLGVGTVAVFSEADARSIYIREADEAVFLGPARAKDSYLVKEKLIESALAHQCEAIHPGYGFLSENAEFAGMVAQAGLVFIGPTASAIAILGDKTASKDLAIQAGVPVVPGFTNTISLLEEAQRAADQIGYPVLLKPAAGGGGKGMRIVFSEKELEDNLKACRQETMKAFGDDAIFMERYIVRPRHVEMQILADHYGNVVYLGERECSIQRRYQKIIEETPSMAVDGALRERMGKTACDLALKAGYANAGTVEFIMDQEGNFYFIEMNTRLQVEHPVTEMVTGLDLVELQLRMAVGEALPFGQQDITVKGWAIEARICAEDPRRDFYPSTGIITRYTAPRGRNLRVDTGIEAGSVVSVYYDSLLAKVVAWGETREEARKVLVYALNGYHIEGLATNVDFVNAILNHPAFVNGELSTDFIEAHFENGHVKLAPPFERIHLMSIAATLVYHNRQAQIRESLKPMAAHVGGVYTPKEYTPYVVKGENDILDLRLQVDSNPNAWSIWVNDTVYNVVTPDFEFYRRRLKLQINGEPHVFRLQYHGNFIWAAFCGAARIFEIYSPREWALARYMPTVEKRLKSNQLECPMPGLIVDIRVQKGDRVYKGQELVIIEAMKMESAVASPRDGEIEDVVVKQGQAVEMGNILVVFKG